MTGNAQLDVVIGGLLGVAGVGPLLVLVLRREVRLYRRSRERRGGLLELDTPASRAAIELGERRRGGEWPWPPAPLLPLIVDPGVPQGTVEVRTTALRRCNPARGVHYHGGGDTCQCGEQPNVFSTRLRGDDAA